MPIKVYNFGYIRDLPKVFDADVSDISLADMIDYLENELNSSLKQTLLNDGKLAERARISINGNPVHSLEAVIPDGSQLMLSLMLPGG